MSAEPTTLPPEVREATDAEIAHLKSFNEARPDWTVILLSQRLSDAKTVETYETVEMKIRRAFQNCQPISAVTFQRRALDECPTYGGVVWHVES